MVATPRLGLSKLKGEKIQLDALIGSALDPDEKYELELIKPEPYLRVSTEGALGGESSPGGRYQALRGFLFWRRPLWER